VDVLDALEHDREKRDVREMGESKGEEVVQRREVGDHCNRR
jgi:hypothetical protein